MSDQQHHGDHKSEAHQPGAHTSGGDHRHRPGGDHGHQPGGGSGHGHQHGGGHHHHGHTSDVDWNTMGEVLERRAAVYAPVYDQIIADLRARTPRPARIIDAGSGPGAVSVRLAEAFPEAEVV
ncbi:SAM-dependent methyltransferase, partial [Streptomyces sp. T-3]|nr:SAM-dependent methyltransferase [Streptomyces sp. T-3]